MNVADRVPQLPPAKPLKDIGPSLLDYGPLNRNLRDPALVTDMAAYTPASLIFDGFSGLSMVNPDTAAFSGLPVTVASDNSIKIACQQEQTTSILSLFRTDEYLVSEHVFHHEKFSVGGSGVLILSPYEGQIDAVCQRLSANDVVFRRYHNSRHEYASSLTYNLRKWIIFALDNPASVERAKNSFTVAKTAMRNSVDSSSASVKTIQLFVWIDGYRKASTAVKVRLYDSSGKVLPQLITPPYTIYQYSGDEGDLHKHSAVIENLIRQATTISYDKCFMMPNCTVKVELTAILADHKAMQIICGVSKGGYSRSPFSAIEFPLLPRNPYDAFCSRLTLGQTVQGRTTLLNGEHQTTLFHSLDNGQVQTPLFCHYDNDTRQFYVNSPSLSQVIVCPPVMHVSHELMRQMWVLLERFTPAVRGNHLQTHIDAAFTRTTGCNEQSWNRHRLAVLSNDYLHSFDETLRPFILIISHLQALLYSKAPVTDYTVRKLFFMGMVTFYFFHVSTLLLPTAQQPRNRNNHDAQEPEAGRDVRQKPYLRYDTGDFAGSLYMHDLIAVLPEVCHRLRIPLFNLLEEYFERDFLLDAIVHREKHRVRTLLYNCQKLQVRRFTAFITGVRTSRKHTDVAPLQTHVNRIRLHKCLWDASSAFSWRNRMFGTSKEVNDNFKGSVQDTLAALRDGLQQHLNNAVPDSFITDGDYLTCVVGDHHDENSTCTVCICQRPSDPGVRPDARQSRQQQADLDQRRALISDDEIQFQQRRARM
ncbi:hypothetical protein J8273_4482 [Carpediemonas membranifera]|uniref:Uncharacterized protein n=1 Tax=Carpediemonas membranifera TaxID=201153 RepID=A0A8J6E478_9EUKA|nr:hypothetical protein J8273_4482 [Carpediemonas membranifera]|eukprot:KAG9394117.1 hypothetical protein J8273_4482 [Carpediemonas membranifera]